MDPQLYFLSTNTGHSDEIQFTSRPHSIATLCSKGCNDLILREITIPLHGAQPWPYRKHSGPGSPPINLN